MNGIPFREIPLFHGLSPIELARLVPLLDEVRFGAGEVIFREGDEADALYIILGGTVEVSGFRGPGAKPTRLAQLGPHECLGELALLTEGRRSATVVAKDEVLALRMSKESFRRFMEERPRAALNFSHLLADRIVLTNLGITRGAPAGEGAPHTPSAATGAGASRPAPEAQEPAKGTKGRAAGAMAATGWVFALVVPVAIWLARGTLDLPPQPAFFLALFSAAVVMWVFKLVDEYVPGVFVMLVAVSTELVPPAAILGGFISDGFFMAMSVLGLGAVIVSSGLSYRVILQILYRLPNSRFWHSTALFASGFFLTPLIPTANGRVALTQPVLNDMADILGVKKRGVLATRLAASTFAGATLMSCVFLSSKSINFVVFGMLPLQVQNQFQWLDWLRAALVPGAVMIALQLAGNALFFRSDESPVLSKEQLRQQLSLLGPMSLPEKFAIFSMLLFVVGVLTSSFHKVSPPWVGLAVLYGLLLFGFLGKKGFREKIDWPFLIYTASTVGIVNAANKVGLTPYLVKAISGVGAAMTGNFELFVLELCGVMFLLRLFVPINTAAIILAALLLPLAEVSGVNPWVVGFAVLALCELWFVPYQSSFYMQFQAGDREAGMYDERRFLRYNVYLNLVRIAALYAALPYWKRMGLL